MPPSGWVERFIGAMPARGRVLDVACGAGRHLALGHERGLRMTGVDRDTAAARAALNGLDGVELIERDLEDGGRFSFEPGSCDGVIVTNYLWRPILSDIVTAVAPGGALIYETFRIGNERFGKPSNPSFLLRPGELLAAVSGKLNVIAFEEVTLGPPRRVVQRICAVADGHPWIADPPQL